MYFRQLSEEDAFDGNMLLAGLLSVLFYNVFLLFLELRVRDEYQLVGALFVVKDILAIGQALRQVRIHRDSRQLKQSTTFSSQVLDPGSLRTRSIQHRTPSQKAQPLHYHLSIGP